ncbi:MAG: MFS transporter [Gemmataceae bacterium]|nr:MFS transporter [Gemmataceae bacterium]
MITPPDAKASRGAWLALIAALLGWMFDGFEMGLFPLVARPALLDLLKGQGLTPAETDAAFSFWFSMATTAFLIGAAAGGVLFGWLGDRIGRVRAMALSILAYSVFSGLGGFAQTPWHIILTRFVAALGMGGEWSLGVALVMEVWKGQSRALLAGVIGAAANAGYLLVGVLSLSLAALRSRLEGLGLPEDWVSWRLLMVCGALPAVLTLLIRLWVPESESWKKEQERGATSSWQSVDLLAVLAGVGVCFALLAAWQLEMPVASRIVLTATAIAVVGGCYLYPILRYMDRAKEPPETRRFLVSRLLVAALISGIPLLATWGAVQWCPAWASQLAEKAVAAGVATKAEAGTWKDYTQMASAGGAVAGSILGALLAGAVGRRVAYIALCLSSLGSVLLFYQGNTHFGTTFVLTAGLMGMTSAAFYGWLPLYLPELFPTRIRATGQGFGFNFGRIIAAIGVLLVPVLIGQGKDADFPLGCSRLAFVYLAGLAAIWLAPETKGQPLPE